MDGRKDEEEKERSIKTGKWGTSKQRVTHGDNETNDGHVAYQWAERFRTNEQTVKDKKERELHDPATGDCNNVFAVQGKKRSGRKRRNSVAKKKKGK
mmetsp:Transcript_55702/g.109055  ORF Transcript_55702/g.109055 Transcript_55702/m.109055 type:complete len:97 (-) Transcript_55702:8-298(-)